MLSIVKVTTIPRGAGLRKLHSVEFGIRNDVTQDQELRSEWTIVHVLTHSSLRRDAVEYNFTEGWHAKLGRSIARFTGYEVECWIVDYEATESRYEQRDGIQYRLFPSSLLPGTTGDRLNPYIGSAKPGVELSLPLLREIWGRSRSDKTVAFHLHSDTYLNTYLIATFFRGTPLILQHHGGLRGASRIERVAFTGLAHAFVLTQEKKRYLTETIGLDPDDVTVQTMGVDFDEFSPRDLTPEDIGYDTDRLLLYVGKYDSYKGLDTVLEAFEAVRENHDVTLALLGGQQSDALYERAKSTRGVDVITEYVPTDQMITYYSAADVYLSYPIEHSLESGDCGIISPIESLACGTPVVSPVLRFFPPSEQNYVGYNPASLEELIAGIEGVLSNETSWRHCRETAAKRFSWEQVAKNVADVYDSKLMD